MNLTTRSGAVLHIPPSGSRSTVYARDGKQSGPLPNWRRAMFADLRGYRQWLMTG